MTRRWSRRECIALAAAPLRATVANRPQSLLFEETFSSPGYQSRWRQEGEQDLEVLAEAGRRFLRIRTRQSVTNRQLHHSVLWVRERFSGDLRFSFRARGQPGNGTIFYMNARTASNSAYSGIFGWPRPDAQEERYSASPDFEAYTFGYLRTPECNLRHVGGVTAAAWPKPWNAENTKRYERESVILSVPSPYGGRCDDWHDFDLSIAGARLSCSVDGKPLFDFTDKGRTPGGTLRWKPLTGGGWTGFRNFQATRVDLAFFRVYRLL